MSRTPARRLIQSILSAEWAIRPEWLNQFARVAERFGESESATLTADEIRAEVRRALAAAADGREAPHALAFDYGIPISEESRATIRDSVAIIPVIGPLYHYADSFHDICGCSSYAQVAADIAAVRGARDAVRAVLLEVDSPGGEVGGCAECAQLIGELAQELPVSAYVSDLGCSAAYWLASAAGEIVTAPTALLGSIGVATAIRVRGTGGNYIEIVSSQSPRKRPDASTDEGRAQIQATLDALADVFIAAVAENRGVDVATVLRDFGAGDVLVGRAAVEAGMADRIGTFEALLAELASEQGGTRRRAAGESLTTEAEMPEQTKAPAADAPAITREYLNANHAELVAAIRTEGATAERERILGIEQVALAGHEALVAECKADPSVDAGEAARRIIAAEKKAGGRHLEVLKADEDTVKDTKNARTQEPGQDEDAAAKRILSA